jgi:hypothetical protein
MPKRNPLFSYLVNFNQRQSCTDSKDNKFIIVENNVHSWPPELVKVESHITVYEFYDAENDCLTPIHYSAYFTHRNGKEYRVHIYFDAKGNFVLGPICAIKQQNQWPPCKASSIEESGILMDFFSTDAVKKIQPWLLTLTQAILKKSKELRGQESIIIGCFSAAGTDLNKKKRFLSDWINNLKTQSSLMPSREHFSARISHLSRIGKQLEIDIAKLARVAKAEKPHQNNDDDDTDQSLIFSPPLKKTSIRHSAEFLETLNAKIRTFEETHSLPETDRADRLVDLAVWLFDVDDRTLDQLSVEQQTRFNQLFKQVDEEGIELFKYYFLAEGALDKEKINRLRIFSHNIGSTELSIAVKRKDIARIGYLFEIDPQLTDSLITLGKKTHFENLMSYCAALAEHRTDVQFVGECITLLTSYGVSLVVNMPNSPFNFLEWLQLIHLDHPLNSVIAELSIWNQPNVYIALREAIIALDETLISPEVRVSKIQMYTQVIRITTKFADIFGKLDCAEIFSSQRGIMRRMNFTVVERIKLAGDSELMDLSCQNLKLGKRLMERLPKEFIELGILFAPTLLDIGSAQLPDMSKLTYEEKRQFLIESSRQSVQQQTSNLQQLQLDSPLQQPSLHGLWRENKKHGARSTPESNEKCVIC